MLVQSIGGLLRAVNKKADGILGAAAGLLCLPYILSGSIDLAKQLFSSLKGAALSAITNIIGGMLDTLQLIVQEAVGRVVGSIEYSIQSALQLVASIVAAIRGVIGFIEDLIKRANDLLAWARNADNCKYAAATLFKCIMSRVISDLADDVRYSQDINFGVVSISDATKKISDKLMKPGNVIQQYMDKASYDIDRATASIDAATLL